MHHYMGEIDGAYRSWGYVRGGMGMVSESIASAARSYGAEIRVNAEVRQILVKDGRAVGVELTNGERIEAKVVASGADPKRTFLKFLERSDLPADFVRGIENFKIEGSSGKANFALSETPSFSALPGNGPHLQGAISIGPSVDYIEKAYDDAKYGDFSHRPFIDMCIPSTLDPTLAPPGKHIMSCFIQYAPYTLHNGRWPHRRAGDPEGLVASADVSLARFLRRGDCGRRPQRPRRGNVSRPRPTAGLGPRATSVRRRRRGHRRSCAGLPRADRRGRRGTPAARGCGRPEPSRARTSVPPVGSGGHGRRGPRRDPNLAGRLEDAGGPDGEIATGRGGLSSVRGTHDRVRDGA